MRAQVLLENETDRSDLVAEHGLSLWIEAGESRVLFDTGPSDACTRNARVLGIELASADVIVISHGHQDHAGGLADVAARAGGAAIYAGEGITAPRYSRTDDGMKSVGLDPQTINAVAHRLRTAEDGQTLVPGVEVLSGFPSVFARPADNQRLLVGGPDGIRPDPFRDELALLLETKTGHVVVSGCSHRGIGNIIKKARDRVGSVAGVIGGFHLHKESDDTIRAMAEAFRGIPRIFAGHCTGGRALEILEGELGQGVVPLTTGLQIEIP